MKPIRIGPIMGSLSAGKHVLNIPLALQGDFAVKPHDPADLLDEAEGRLSGKANDIMCAIEDHFTSGKRYTPAVESQIDNIITVDATNDENALYIRVKCDDMNQAREIAEIVKGNPELMADVELVAPRVVNQDEMSSRKHER